MIDAVEVCINALSEMPGVEVVSDMPPKHPNASTIQVSQTGGYATDFINRPIMTFLVWGETDAEAYSLATESIHLMAEKAEDDPYLSASELISMSRDEWRATGQSRYMVQLRLTINRD